jgi:hypothetical protein
MVLLAVACTHPPKTPNNLVTTDCQCPPDYPTDYPNPFSPLRPCMQYVVTDTSHICLVVCNVERQPVDTLVNSIQAPGEYCLVWSAEPDVPSGVYFFKLTTGDTSLTKRVILLQ